MRNMKKKLKPILIIVSTIFSLLIMGIFLMIIFSPFGNQEGQDYKSVKENILIKAPVEKVYSYLGNSKNAREWSVYIDHINTLNSDQIADGEQGSIRQCFVNEDEKGKRWYEETLFTELNTRRRLSCYKFIDFEITAGTLYTEQVYEETKDGHCLLSFTLFIPPGESTFWKRLKIYYGAYEVARVFEKNLKNIKKYNEI